MIKKLIVGLLLTASTLSAQKATIYTKYRMSTVEFNTMSWTDGCVIFRVSGSINPIAIVCGDFTIEVEK